jgi:protein O-GlcNAc transferase
MDDCVAVRRFDGRASVVKKRRQLPLAVRPQTATCLCGSGRLMIHCCGTREIAREMAAAVAAHQSNRLDVAYAGYQSILAGNPQHADAVHYTGVIQFQRNTLEEAVATIRRAIELRADIAAYHANLGNALKRLGRSAEALEAFARSLQLDPGQSAIHFNHALLLAELGRNVEAIAAFRETVRLRPDWPQAWQELGNLLYAEEVIDAAAEAYRNALRLDPRLLGAHNMLGTVLLRFGEVEEAISSFTKAIPLDPANEAACASRLFALGLSNRFDGTMILAEHRAWQTRFADGIAPIVLPACSRGSRLRVAYLSGDLRRHAMRFFVRPILHHHDRSRVSVTAYATHSPQQDDAITDEFRPLVDRWINCHDLDHATLARRIADDGIDILIDLAGHTAGGRMLTLAARPAPFQCTMLGYMTTTGAQCIDARIADAVAIPPTAEAWFSEKILRLPGSQWCYAPDDPLAPPVKDLPALDNGHITYGSFHNVAKINSSVLALWRRMLTDQPSARLVMVGWGEAAKHHLRQAFELAGLGARVTVLDPLPHDRYLELYDRVDISLDVFPYSGGTVNCESLWMGVPVLTLAHRSPAGRGGASIMSALGMPDWIVRDEEEWLARSAQLSSDLASLQALRGSLRERMRSSRLMDAATYVADLENLLVAQV